MTKVFIGGSRRISRLSATVRQRIDSITNDRVPVLVGDANGTDKAVQRYLQVKGYPLVEVFCTGDHCRNRLGDWPLRHVEVKARAKRFADYALKDRMMADEATFGFMIWDGKSLGTLMNVVRLLRQQKEVVVYVAPSHEVLELEGDTEWDSFLARWPAEIRRRVEHQVAVESPPAGTIAQLALL